ncbi:MAG: 3-dehydroquinate synthase [Bacilli bacterium]|nr:3-dehydroquinate synthase [Bacilli bacterium]
MTERLTVQLGTRSYPIYVGTGLLSQVGELLRELNVSSASPLLLITDTNLAAAGYAELVSSSVQEQGYQIHTAVFPAGEASKSLEQAANLFERCLQAGLDRGSTILALGGGVVGDLAGFIAAAYMRGIDFIGLPTTVLAHDSSVGGKVAVNLPSAKNIVGSFHQPRAVIYDVSALHTLSERETRSGLAEVVKHALLDGEEFVGWLEARVKLLLAREETAMMEALCRGLRVKAAVVAQDERESNIRAHLNLGHTLGHAIEAVTGYTRYTHGEAISIGMHFAYLLAESLGRTTAETRKRAVNLLSAFGLPTLLPADLPADQLLARMYEDKKSIGRELTFVLPKQFGQVEVVKGIDPADVSRLLTDRKGWGE